MLLLTIEDAVKVALAYIGDHCYDYAIDKQDELLLCQEMEQKCWIHKSDDDHLKRLINLIMDVNPAEICDQIQNDHLKQWCITIQTAIQIELMQIQRE